MPRWIVACHQAEAIMCCETRCRPSFTARRGLRSRRYRGPVMTYPAQGRQDLGVLVLRPSLCSAKARACQDWLASLRCDSAVTKLRRIPASCLGHALFSRSFREPAFLNSAYRCANKLRGPRRLFVSAETAIRVRKKWCCSSKSVRLNCHESPDVTNFRQS